MEENAIIQCALKMLPFISRLKEHFALFSLHFQQKQTVKKSIIPEKSIQNIKS